MRAAVALAFAIACTACPGGSGSGGPVRECTRIGEQCIIEEGLLGVCSVAESECAAPPCLICRPQH